MKGETLKKNFNLILLGVSEKVRFMKYFTTFVNPADPDLTIYKT